jgi:hypothetical protein
MVTVMEYFANEMCKCTAKTCTDKVNDDLIRWATDAAKHATKDEKPDSTVAERATDIMNRYADCMTKVMIADPGSGLDDPPPPEEEDNPCGD